jgi:signal transduction histidine kinase
MTLLYGLRRWSVSTTVMLVGAVVLVTGAALARPVIQSGEGLDELAADPLLAGIFIAMAWHASRRQTALAELRHTTQERDFIRDASHQLRTPITVARGHAELILEAHPRSLVVGDVKVIAGELERLSTISDRLLMLAAAEQPGFIDCRPVDMESLVADTVVRWRPVAARRWHTRVARPGVALIDRERVECALDALIENAVNATANGDHIGIVAAVDSDTTTIDIVDEGRGIGVHNGGTGLGLRIVTAIAEAHGGSVTVVSAPGKGTTVRLRLNGSGAGSDDGTGCSAPRDE